MKNGLKRVHDSSSSQVPKSLHLPYTYVYSTLPFKKEHVWSLNDKNKSKWLSIVCFFISVTESVYRSVPGLNNT